MVKGVEWRVGRTASAMSKGEGRVTALSLTKRALIFLVAGLPSPDSQTHGGTLGSERAEGPRGVGRETLGEELWTVVWKAW